MRIYLHRSWPALLLGFVLLGLLALHHVHLSPPVEDVAHAQTGDVTMTWVGGIDGNMTAVAVQDAVAYIGGGGAFAILDVRTPTAPRFISRVAMPSRVWDIQIVGGYAYLADGEDGGLQVVDVSHPATPALVGRDPVQARGCQERARCGQQLPKP